MRVIGTDEFSYRKRHRYLKGVVDHQQRRVVLVFRGRGADSLAYIKEGYTNAIVAGINNRIRTIARRAYGFHSAAALRAMIFLCLGGIKLNPPLPTH